MSLDGERGQVPVNFPGLVKSPGLVWSLLTLVSGVNIAVWFLLYRSSSRPAISALRPASSPWCCGRAVSTARPASGSCCCFARAMFLAAVQIVASARGRSADLPVRHLAVERCCRRSVATVAELCFAAQWAVILHQLGTMTGTDTTLNVAWVILPLNLIAECYSWYAVLTTKLSGQRHRKFDMGRHLLTGRDRPLPVAAGVRRPGSRGPRHRDHRDRRLSSVSHDHRRPDVSEPMADRGWRWQQAVAALEGLRDVSTRWIVTHDLADGRTRLPGCRFISVWQSGPASRCAFSTRSPIICALTRQTPVASRSSGGVGSKANAAEPRRALFHEAWRLPAHPRFGECRPATSISRRNCAL